MLGVQLAAFLLQRPCSRVTDKLLDPCHPEVALAGEGPKHFEHKTYFVYIMSNRSKTLYTGITNSLYRRVRQHKEAVGSEFTTRYKVDRLVYYERFDDVHRAIGREKQIKGLLRIKKIALIVSVNPTWRDLSEGWYDRHQFEPCNKIRSNA